MKIINQPKFVPCTCKCCKTVFQVENGDKIDSYTRSVQYADERKIVETILLATCPVCGYGEVPLNGVIKHNKPVIKKASEMKYGDVFRTEYGEYGNWVEVVFEKCEAGGVTGTSTKVTVHYVGGESFDMFDLDPIEKAEFAVVGEII